jgi:hypothetical protein
MKLRQHFPAARPRATTRAGQQARLAGFTLADIQITMAVTVLLFASLFSSHLLGLKLNELTRSKLTASDAARNTISKLVDDIRSAKLVQVGNGTQASFAAVASGSAQQGSAIRIYPSTNTNSFVVYYRNSGDSTLRRATNGAGSAKIIAQFITNSVVFASENYGGTVLTDNQNNRVISLNLQFYQIQYPIVTVGQGGLYDYYQLRTKVTRRAVE